MDRKESGDVVKIHEQIEQGSIEWLRLRIGRVTASELDNLISPEWKARTGETPKTYLCTKVAEAYRGDILPNTGSWSTEQGSILEDEAVPWYELEFDETVRRVGFVEGDGNRCGCSPDGLLGEDGGIEIKCPSAPVHVKYLLADVLPKDYVAQVHMSMFVTGRKWWRFVSYRRRFPALVLTIERDEEICAKIQDVLTKFYADFDAAMAKLKSFT